MDHSIYGLAYVEHLSYLGTYLAVAFSGYAIPIPEEIILILAGFLSAQGISNIFIMCLVGFLGALTGDTLIYYLSRRGSRFTEKYHAAVEKTKAGWYVRNLRKHTARTVFLSRFIIGMRLINPLVSGFIKVPARTFVTASILSAAIYVPLIIALGYYFHDQIHILLKIVHSIRQGMFIALIIGSLFLIFAFFRNLVEKNR